MPDNLPNVNDWKALTANVRRGLPPSLLDRLIQIDSDLSLYAQAFSMMAKRNLAADIYAGAVKLRDAWPREKGGEKAPDRLLQLIEQARNAVQASGGTTQRQYDSAVCIGYPIKLSNFTRPQGEWIVAYQGEVDDRADMLSRCDKMRTAIREAYDAYQAKFSAPAPPPSSGLHPPDRTLRLFMAPEFYFRGRNGAYPSDVAFDVLSKLREETNKPKYRNWLFVLGSVIMATFVEETVCPRCGVTFKKDRTTGESNCTTLIDRATGISTLKCKVCDVTGKIVRVGAMIDNLALIQKGGETGSDNSYTVSKEYVSHVDFKREFVPTHSGGYVLPDWDGNPHDRLITVMGQTTTVLPPEGSRDISVRPVGSKFLDERMGSGGSVFDIDGIRFGVEICLDHYNARLSGKEGVDIQLVPSCGAEFQEFRCKPDGIYFGVDADSASCDLRVNSSAPHPINFTPVSCSAGGQLVVYDPLPIA